MSFLADEILSSKLDLKRTAYPTCENVGSNRVSMAPVVTSVVKWLTFVNCSWCAPLLPVGLSWFFYDGSHRCAELELASTVLSLRSPGNAHADRVDHS